MAATLGRPILLPAEALCLCAVPRRAERALTPPWRPHGSGGPTAGEPHTHPRNSREKRGKGEWEKEQSRAGPGAVGSSPVLGTPWSCPCPNLTFIEKSIRHRGPLSNLPENTMGEGQLRPGPQHKDPRPLETRWNSMGEKAQALGAS